MAMKTLGPEEKQKKDKPEVLLFLTKIRSKSINDEYGKVYYPGDQETFRGSAKLQLLAMGAATRDLKTVVEHDENKPDLTKMNTKSLDKFAKEKYQVDISKLRTKNEKLKAIKSAEQDKNEK